MYLRDFCSTLLLFAFVIACKEKSQDCCNDISSSSTQSVASMSISDSFYMLKLNSIRVESSIPAYKDMVLIPGGKFIMGSNDEQARADEQPQIHVQISDFYLDSHEVTNQEFSLFVKATGYRTIAEESMDTLLLKAQLPPNTPLPDATQMQPFSLLFNQPPKGQQVGGYHDWWKVVLGANWQKPLGPSSSIEKLMDHPVVHIAWYDAAAYCKWKGGRLPSEAEWEYAARGGDAKAKYAWEGEELSTKKLNFWQGEFPFFNSVEDKHVRTSPAKSYAPNAYGLYDMSGNVWEWTADWYRHDHYTTVYGKGVVVDPVGPSSSYDPDEPLIAKKSTRGGSFLCNDSYCSGYRITARMKTSPDTSLEHTGCRCAKDKK